MTRPAPADAPCTPTPTLGAVVARVTTSLVVATAIPGALFYLCLVLAGPWHAIGAALLWSYAAIAWRALTRRRTSGLLVLVAVLMTGRTLVAVASDSTWVYFLQPVLSDVVVGGAFLLSLASARPMVARLAGDFYPLDHAASMRPRVRRLFRHLTVFWALLCLGKASMTLWLLQSQTLETFVLVKSLGVLVVNVLAAGATIAVASAVARQEGLLGPRRAAPVPAPVPVSVRP